MRKFATALLLAICLAPAFAAPAMADDRWDHDQYHSHGHYEPRSAPRSDARRGPAPGGAWQGDPHWRGDIHTFRDHDIQYWHTGRWVNGPHGGRRGWWWVLGNNWYFYPAPVYPYPNPYMPPVMASPPPRMSYWYYCHNPRGYYPYVAACLNPWQSVPAY